MKKPEVSPSGPQSAAGPDAVSDPPSPAPAAPPVLAVGAGAQLRKPHACGGLAWKITRVGADIGLECATCARRILLPRDEFQRRLKRLL